MAATFKASAQMDFGPDKEISNVKATVHFLNEDLAVLIPDADAGGRYISPQLPEEYKKEGLKVTFNGVTGKIPPNVRMMGTPLTITKIWVTCAEKKKFKLKKCKYVIKQ